MKTAKKEKLQSQAIITIDPSSSRYDDANLFPKKLAHANEILKTARIPEHPDKKKS